MIRLQRVTFLALHDYLGLTTELTRSNDEISQLQTSNQQHHRHRRTRVHSHTTVLQSIPVNPTDVAEDSNENQNFQPIRSLSDDVQATNLLKTESNQQEPEHPTDGQSPSISTSKERAASFTGQRSYSVIESRYMNPDFEEAAARARVKNSLDTTFFEKHKISYPNISNNRSLNAGARRRTSFSDVKLHYHLFSSYSNSHFSIA